jgi:hypothetical protein
MALLTREQLAELAAASSDAPPNGGLCTGAKVIH